MMPISGINTGAVQPLAAAEKVPGASKIQKEEEEVRPLKPTMDETSRRSPGNRPAATGWAKTGTASPRFTSTIRSGRRMRLKNRVRMFPRKNLIRQIRQ